MDEGYNIYISQNIGNEMIVLKLPANPEEIEFKYDIDNKKYNVLSLGDVIRIGTKGLNGFTVKSFFPADENPDVSIFTIEKMIANKLPLNFKINKLSGNKFALDINMDVVVDSFSHSEKGGEVGDIEYSLKMTEYREHKAKVI